MRQCENMRSRSFRDSHGSIGRGIIDHQHRHIAKLLTDASDDLGDRTLLVEAGDQDQQSTFAGSDRSENPAQWDATCAVHPTMAEELVTLKEKQSNNTSAG